MIIRPTPKLTHHARERCEEMGVRTRRVKAILRDPDLTYVSQGGRIAWRADDPEIAVVFKMYGDQPVALTVVPRTQDVYTRTVPSPRRERSVTPDG